MVKLEKFYIGHDMKKAQPIPKVNQYNAALLAAEFIRKNPNSPVVKGLKRCKDQDELKRIVERIYE